MLSAIAIAFAVGFLTIISITPFVIRFAKKTGALDQPDARKVHKQPIPRIGGLGIFIAFMAAICVYFSIAHQFPEETTQSMIGLLLGASLIVVLGLIDDYKNLPAKVKLLGQIVCACIAVYFGVRIDFITDPFGDILYFEDILAIPISIFWLVGITNTVNLIDGLDGLAAGVVAIASATIFLVAMQENILIVALVTAILIGVSFGFLLYNFNPAKIFMGDTGSMFFGFIFAGISIIGAVKCAATIALVIPILALGVPILDTTFAIVRRYRNGVPIFKPDKGHLHHRLLNLGFSQRQAVLLMYMMNAVLGFSAIALTEVNFYVATLIVLGVIIAVLYGAKRIGIFQAS